MIWGQWTYEAKRSMIERFVIGIKTEHNILKSAANAQDKFAFGTLYRQWGMPTWRDSVIGLEGQIIAIDNNNVLLDFNELLEKTAKITNKPIDYFKFYRTSTTGEDHVYYRVILAQNIKNTEFSGRTLKSLWGIIDTASGKYHPYAILCLSDIQKNVFSMSEFGRMRGSGSLTSILTVYKKGQILLDGLKQTRIPPDPNQPEPQLILELDTIFRSFKQNVGKLGSYLETLGTGSGRGGSPRLQVEKWRNTRDPLATFTIMHQFEKISKTNFISWLLDDKIANKPFKTLTGLTKKNAIDLYQKLEVGPLSEYIKDWYSYKEALQASILFDILTIRGPLIPPYKTQEILSLKLQGLGQKIIEEFNRLSGDDRELFLKIATEIEGYPLPSVIDPSENAIRELIKRCYWKMIAPAPHYQNSLGGNIPTIPSEQMETFLLPHRTTTAATEDELSNALDWIHDPNPPASTSTSTTPLRPSGPPNFMLMGAEQFAVEAGARPQLQFVEGRGYVLKPPKDDLQESAQLAVAEEVAQLAERIESPLLSSILGSVPGGIGCLAPTALGYLTFMARLGWACDTGILLQGLGLVPSSSASLLQETLPMLSAGSTSLTEVFDEILKLPGWAALYMKDPQGMWEYIMALGYIGEQTGEGAVQSGAIFYKTIREIPTKWYQPRIIVANYRVTARVSSSHAIPLQEQSWQEPIYVGTKTWMKVLAFIGLATAIIFALADNTWDAFDTLNVGMATLSVINTFVNQLSLFSGIASSILSVYGIIMTLFAINQLSQAIEQTWKDEALNRVGGLTLQLSPHTPPSTNASIIRNGGLREGDVAGIRVTVKNCGSLILERHKEINADGYETLPWQGGGGSSSSPFWFRSRIKTIVQSSIEDWGEEDWRGPWAGNPINWNTWNLPDKPAQDVGALVFPAVSLYDVVDWDWHFFPMSDPVTYEMVTPVSATANLGFQFQVQIATTYEGRTDHDVFDPINMVVGDSNGDGIIDPLYEQGLPVLETSLDSFLAACVNVIPTRTLGDYFRNYTSSAAYYQWRDAANYLIQAITLANTSTIFSETQFNETVANLENLTGSFEYQTWRSFGDCEFHTDPVPASVVDGYYLLQASGADQWMALLGGEQGQALLDAGWHAARPLYSATNTPLFKMDFNSTGAFPEDWVKEGESWFATISVDWRDPGLQDRRVLRIVDNDAYNSYTSVAKDFGPMFKGRIGAWIEYSQISSSAPVYFGLASSTPNTGAQTSWTNVAMFNMRYNEALGEVQFYYGLGSTPILSMGIPPYCNFWVVIEFDVAAGTATLDMVTQSATVPLQAKIPVTQWRTYTPPSASGVNYWIRYLTFAHLEGEQAAHLNGYALTSRPGQILVPKAWVAESRQAYEVLKTYPQILAQLPCTTNIAAGYSWSSGTPALKAGETFAGEIAFTYMGGNTPPVTYEITPPAGWDLTYKSQSTPLKNLLAVPFTLEAPVDAPAGTYYVDFIERLADGSVNAGNVTFACRIPIRVRYNASWALDMAGLPDTLNLGSSNAWASLFNGGTTPQRLYVTGDGVPLAWLSAEGYTPIASWDFNGGTSGWALAGPSSASFEADQVRVDAIKSINTLGYGGGYASAYYDNSYQEWVYARTYFTVPAAAPSYASPLSATFYKYVAAVVPGTTAPDLLVSPANGPFDYWTLTWGNQPGFAGDQHAWGTHLNALPPEGWIAITSLAFGETYAMWIDGPGQAIVSYALTTNSLSGCILHVYDKVTADSNALVLQSNANEVVTAVKDLSALVYPGDEIRITYENDGATGATLGAWETFSLGGSGIQECTFVADGFYTLANLSVSAQVGPGASFRVDSISLERSLTLHDPLAELAFAGESSTPAQYGWSATFGSGFDTIWVDQLVTNAAYVRHQYPTTNYGAAPYLYTDTAYQTLVELPAYAGAWETFGSLERWLALPLYSRENTNCSAVQARECGAFDEANVTWANQPAADAGVVATLQDCFLDLYNSRGFPVPGYSYHPYLFDVSATLASVLNINVEPNATWVFYSDDYTDAEYRPRVVYGMPKWGVAGGALLVQSDCGESFSLARPLAEDGLPVTLQAGDKVWASFETTSAEDITLTLLNEDTAGNNLQFILATATDQGKGTIAREFIVPADGNYTALVVSGALGAGENFSLSFAGVYHYQPGGAPLADAIIGGFYNETIAPAAFTAYAPLAGGSFTFDGTTGGFAGSDASSTGGSLVLTTAAPATLAATCALAGIAIASNSARARARFNSTVAGGITITFTTEYGDHAWALPTGTPGSWQEATFALPAGNTIDSITVSGTFAAGETLLLDYLVLEEPTAAPAVLPEVAGHRAVLALKNVAASGGAASYSFAAPQVQGRLDFCAYAPGTNATLAITLEGAGGESIYLEIVDWQLWLANLTGAIPAASIYGGWHSLSIAWDCVNHNYTVWYFNHTLIEANYTAGWGILHCGATAITGVRFGMADNRSAFYVDGVYLDPVAQCPSNQSLVEAFLPGGGYYFDLRPGEEWSLQLAAPPRSYLTAPGTYPVHLAIYDASTGQLVGLVDKTVTVPPFYDCHIDFYFSMCEQGYTYPWPVMAWNGENFTFGFTLANDGNVVQDFALSIAGAAGIADTAFYANLGAGMEPVTHLELAPGAAQAVELQVTEALPQRCDFTVWATAAGNATSFAGTFCNDHVPDSEFGQWWPTLEWEPAVEVEFTFWDDTVYDPIVRVGFSNDGIVYGPWASGVPIPVVTNGAGTLYVIAYDGFPDGGDLPYHGAKGYQTAYITYVNNILPVIAGPANQTTAWDAPLGNLVWTVTDGATWAGWQDSFAGFYGEPLSDEWVLSLPIGSTISQVGGVLQISTTGYDVPAARVLAPAGDFAFTTEIASNAEQAGILVGPATTTSSYLKWHVSPYRYGSGWVVAGEYAGTDTTQYLETPPLSEMPRFLRVARQSAAGTWSLWYSFDNIAWTCYRDDIAWAPAASADLYCGLFAWNNATFEWARVTTGQPVAGAQYAIYRNDTLVQQGEWASFQTITASLEGLRSLGPGAIGMQVFTLVVSDVLGGTVTSSCEVTITQVAPVLSSPADFSCVDGTAPSIAWDAVDKWGTSPTYAVIYGPLGGTGATIAAGTWEDRTTITATLPTLPAGTYYCRVTTANSLGGTSEDEVIITVMPDTLALPAEVASEEVPAGNQTLVMDFSTFTLDVALNTTSDVTVAAGTWDANPAVSSPELASAGVYFSLEVSDPAAVAFPLVVTLTYQTGDYPLWGQLASPEWFGIYTYDEGTGEWVLADFTILEIRVYDTVEGWFVDVTLSVTHLSLFAAGFVNLPPVLSAPADLSYWGGSTGNAITWQVSDNTTLNPTYTITRDSVVVASGAWPEGGAISINVDGLGTGSHEFTLAVDDGLNATAFDTVLVVVDNDAPTITAPPDILYAWGTTGNAITWAITDDTLLDPTYTITQDGNPVASGAWPASKVITWGVDGLAVGTYRYVLAVSDGLGSTASDEVMVTVRNTLPMLSSALDVTYEYGSAAPAIAWTVADGSVRAGTYAITLGGFAVAGGTWAGGETITWAPGDLLPGTWAVTLIVDDGYGGLTSDTVAITVTNANPLITGQHSAIFEVGDAGAGAWVTITDPSAASDAAYSIYRNGTRVASGRWASGDSFCVNLTYTPPGRHDYEIVAWDGLGGVASHYLLATTTNVAPVVDGPALVSFEAGTVNATLNWTVKDESAENATYALYVDGVVIANSTWVSGDVVSLAVGTWMPGTYNASIVVADGWGAVAESSTLVVVTNAVPVVVAPPAISYEAGDPRAVASFAVTDASILDPTYAAYLNGTLVASGNWASGTNVTIPASGLTNGTYVLSLVAADGYGGTTNATTTITVRPDDDTTCDLADLTCIATPANVTVTALLADPSGYSAFNYLHVDGTVPANLSGTINATHVILWFPNAYGPGEHVVSLSLADGDNDWPGDAATAAYNCTFFNGPDVQAMLDAVDAGIALIWASNGTDWYWPVVIHKAAMAAQLAVLRALIEAGNYSWAYALLLYNIKPCLTGLKTDEHEVPWSNCTCNATVVKGAALREQFRLWANALLQDLEDAHLIVEAMSYGASTLGPAPASTAGHMALAGCGFALLALLGIGLWVMRQRTETFLANMTRGMPPVC